MSAQNHEQHRDAGGQSTAILIRAMRTRRLLFTALLVLAMLPPSWTHAAGSPSKAAPLLGSHPSDAREALVKQRAALVRPGTGRSPRIITSKRPQPGKTIQARPVQHK